MYFHYGLKLASLDVNKRFRSCATLLPHYFLNKSSKEKGNKKILHLKPFLSHSKELFFFSSSALTPSGLHKIWRHWQREGKKELKSDNSFKTSMDGEGEGEELLSCELICLAVSCEAASKTSSAAIKTLFGVMRFYSSGSGAESSLRLGFWVLSWVKAAQSPPAFHLPPLKAELLSPRSISTIWSILRLPTSCSRKPPPSPPSSLLLHTPANNPSHHARTHPWTH